MFCYGVLQGCPGSGLQVSEGGSFQVQGRLGAISKMQGE